MFLIKVPPLISRSKSKSFYSSTLREEAAHYSEASINFYHTTQYHTPEQSTLHTKIQFRLLFHMDGKFGPLLWRKKSVSEHSRVYYVHS
jgi:hypothetical protein